MSLRIISGINFHYEVFWCAILLKFWLAAFELTFVKPSFIPLYITKVFKKFSWKVYLLITITIKGTSLKNLGQKTYTL